MQGSEVVNLIVEDVVNLIVEDQVIPASRTILSAASPVLSAMLSSSFREADAQDIPLPGKSYDDVQYMYDFISLPDTPLLTGMCTHSLSYLTTGMKAAVIYTRLTQPTTVACNCGDGRVPEGRSLYSPDPTYP